MVQTFRKKLMVSLVYPALLVSVVTMMLVFLITYVVPEFADLFNNLGANLPAITRVHAVARPERAEIWMGIRGDWAGRRRRPAVALEEQRSGRRAASIESCSRCRWSATSG